MNSPRTQLRKKPHTVDELPRMFGNPFSNDKSVGKALSNYTNAVLDMVAGA